MGNVKSERKKFLTQLNFLNTRTNKKTAFYITLYKNQFNIKSIIPSRR